MPRQARCARTAQKTWFVDTSTVLLANEHLRAAPSEHADAKKLRLPRKSLN
jgi:hypothetical protein